MVDEIRRESHLTTPKKLTNLWSKVKKKEHDPNDPTKVFFYTSRIILITSDRKLHHCYQHAGCCPCQNSGSTFPRWFFAQSFYIALFAQTKQSHHFCIKKITVSAAAISTKHEIKQFPTINLINPFTPLAPALDHYNQNYNDDEITFSIFLRQMPSGVS